MAIVRVRPDVSPTAWWDDGAQAYVTLTPGGAFNSNDPAVKANPWAFQVDADEDNIEPRRTSVGVEEATATPGAKRNR